MSKVVSVTLKGEDWEIFKMMCEREEKKPSQKLRELVKENNKKYTEALQNFFRGKGE